MRLIWLCACLAASGCGGKGLSDYMDDDLPAGNCEDTDASLCETGGQGDQCEDTQFCTGELICAASFDGDIGTFECQSACVETMDETRWCTDSASCCDSGAVCGARGYCMLPGNVDTGSDGTTSSGSTTSGLDTGTGTETSSGTDTSSSTDEATSTGVTSG